MRRIQSNTGYSLQRYPGTEAYESCRKDGKSRYAILTEPSAELGDKYTRILQDTLTSLDVGQNMLVIRTVPGMAMGVAAALDALKWKEILGSIAGDDTVMCVARDAEQAEIVAEKLKGILKLC